MKLTDIKEIRGRIILITGLHIGSGDMEMKIGGTDNPVIKHPYTNEPYIPGSSLKGKVRSLLEMRTGLMEMTRGSPLSVKDMVKLGDKEKQECRKILRLFGTSGADDAEAKEHNLGPTRVSFADCPLDKEWKEKVSTNTAHFIEVKSENSINRILGTALNPRFTERVPADTEFEFYVALKQFENDEDFETLLLEGLKLLSMDYLGGSGSRGYGRIEFKFKDKTIQEKFQNLEPLGGKNVESV